MLFDEQLNRTFDGPINGLFDGPLDLMKHLMGCLMNPKFNGALDGLGPVLARHRLNTGSVSALYRLSFGSHRLYIGSIEQLRARCTPAAAARHL